MSIFEPAILMWKRLSPIGRVVLFLPGIILFYALFIAVAPFVIFGDWFERTRFAKYVDEKVTMLFLSKP